MTLIVSSLRADDVLITADGRSRTIVDGHVTGTIDNYQKIFPVPGRTLAIYHHGENRLDGLPVQQFLAPVIAGLNGHDTTVQEIAEKLRHYAGPHIATRLQELDLSAAGCGFCIVGFDRGTSEPRMIEIFWPAKPHGDTDTSVECNCIVRQWGPTSVIVSGDGQRLIGDVDWREVSDKADYAVRNYHQSLFERAMATKLNAGIALAEPVAHGGIWAEPLALGDDRTLAPAEPFAHNTHCVGGHVHELHITRGGWEWTIPPQV